MWKFIRNILLFGLVAWIFFATEIDEIVLGRFSPHDFVVGVALQDIRRWAVIGLMVMVGLLAFILWISNLFHRRDLNRQPVRERPIQAARARPMQRQSRPRQHMPPVIILGNGGQGYGQPTYGQPNYGRPSGKVPGKIAKLPASKYEFWDGLSVESMGEKKYND